MPFKSLSGSAETVISYLGVDKALIDPWGKSSFALEHYHTSFAEAEAKFPFPILKLAVN